MGRYGDRGGGEKQEGKERLEKTDQVGAGRGRGRQGEAERCLGREAGDTGEGRGIHGGRVSISIEC